MQKNALTLYELNALVREVMESSMPQAYWVEAEVSEVREVRGHCYMELIQKDLFSPTPVARASAKCWKSAWMSLRSKFERATGQRLCPGMKVLLSVTANFHEAFGFSWIVHDVDPTYTMGDMARKRQDIIHQLKEQGVFDMQKELEIPMFAQRIAVVSSENAAGYGDFCQQLATNDYGLRFYPQLFPAVMQGDLVESSVIAALDRINRLADRFDVVVIIRGGGATADMSGFDTLALAENVANFPLPIITGIGHDRDESILDMVSNTRVKTPTAAAAFLIDHLAAVWTHLENCQYRITTHIYHRMEREHARLNRCADRIPMLFSMVKTRQEARLDRYISSIRSLIQNHITQQRHRLQLISSAIRPHTERRMKDERHRLEQLQTRLHILNPEVLLRRGYSITLHQGKIVREAKQLHPGDKIETRLKQGTIQSVVE